MRAAAFFLLCALACAAAAQSVEALLNAAKTAADRGDAAAADDFLHRIPGASLDLQQLGRVQSIRAQLFLQRDQPLEALQQLPASSAHLPTLAAEVEWLRGQALFRLGDAPSAVRALVERERYLKSPQQVNANRDAIWAGLFATPLDENLYRRMESLDPESRGWIELAMLARDGGDPEQWKAVYRQHPGTGRLGSVRRAPASAGAALRPVSNLLPFAASPLPDRRFSSFSGTPDSAGALALLLPLSGPQAASGEAVRDGFLAAAVEARATVRVYDAGSSAESAADAYYGLLRDQPAVVVGPLRKDAVSAIAQQGAPVPWLALNYLEGQYPPPNTLQFGLAPEDEARAAAEHAVAQGLRRALVLVPQAQGGNDWGERAHAAFSRRLSELGGGVVAAGRYGAGGQNFAAPIRELLGLDQSEARHRALANTLGAKSEFEPRRRDDADFIFLAARPADGRLLWPQLRFYRSAELPVYATSLIYEGRADTELNGLRFCDAPYMLSAAGDLAELRAQVAELPSAKAQPRLFALGQDAFRLARLMQSGALEAGADLDAATGRLSFANGSVTRVLACAEIKDGQPRELVR